MMLESFFLFFRWDCGGGPTRVFLGVKILGHQIVSVIVFFVPIGLVGGKGWGTLGVVVGCPLE